MSFDIFLQCFRKGAPTAFKREVFEEVFLPFCDDRHEYEGDPDFMRVEFPDGSGSDIYLGSLRKNRESMIELGEISEADPFPRDRGDPEDLESLMFNHGGGDMFFQAMYELADRTQSVIFWPSEGPSTVVTNESVLKELPEDFPDIKTARIVRSGADIIEAIETS